MLFNLVNLSQLSQFDEVIDVRSPAEFAEDHIPGARNCPVLDDAERIRVGTLYKQVSAFEARKVGAVLVARNIAQHLEQHFSHQPKSWRPLIYCWRGGQRSGAMTTIFNRVGWQAQQLEGGYKAYRHAVRQQLAQLPAQLPFKVLCAPSGCGKSRLLQALQRAGRQVLDLEALAQHRGSVLGRVPNTTQPTQKWFDSLLCQQLQSFNPDQPIYIEAESKRVGLITLPDALIDKMHHSPCLLLSTSLAERVRFLQEDYDFYLKNPELLIQQLSFLKGSQSNSQLESWQSLARQGEFASLVSQLLEQHYDPLYYRSMSKHYPQLDQAQPVVLDSLAQSHLDALAQSL